MSKTCGRCEIIGALQNMLKDVNSTITPEEKRRVIKLFTEGEITFREVGVSLGLSDDIMVKYTDNTKRYINGTETK